MNLQIHVRRGGFVESIHEANAVLVGADDKILASYDTGAGSRKVLWRSAAKFAQAVPLVESGAVDGFGLSVDEVAIACGSHNGGPEHLSVVRSLLRKAGLSQDQLHCGPHPPYDDAEARELRRQGGEPSKLHNNCSGKHAGMIAACRAMGLSPMGYEKWEHPFQQHLLQILSRLASVPLSEIGHAVDGCGVVAYRTPLVGMARLFRRFACGEYPQNHTRAGTILRDAVCQAPQMIAGKRRLCTALIEVTKGRLIAKVGAEGIYGLGVRPGGDRGTGIFGLALKVQDGAMRANGPALLGLLTQVGLLSQTETSALAPYGEVPLFNHQRDRVGEIVYSSGGASQP